YPESVVPCQSGAAPEKAALLEGSGEGNEKFPSPPFLSSVSFPRKEIGRCPRRTPVRRAHPRRGRVLRLVPEAQQVVAADVKVAGHAHDGGGGGLPLAIFIPFIGAVRQVQKFGKFVLLLLIGQPQFFQAL